METEFADASQFNSRVNLLIERFAKEGKLGGGPLFGKPYPKEFVQAYIRLFRPPLARIAKKANRQIRTSKTNLNLPNAHGLLLCVNDEFRSLEPQFIKGLFSQIFLGSCSSVNGFIYHTNHYVDVPWSEYAHIIWTPMYSEEAPMELVEFVDNLGRKWFDFCESEGVPSDVRFEGPHLSFDGARAIKRRNTGI